jgi:hypothetical protein
MPVGLTSLFSGPRRRTGRVLAPRPGSGDRPVRVWVQGSRARRANARGRSTTPHLSSPPCRWKAGAWWARRAVLRRAGECGHPCAPVLGGEDGALARRPQAPLEVVEKSLPSTRRPGTAERNVGMLLASTRVPLVHRRSSRQLVLDPRRRSCRRHHRFGPKLGWPRPRPPTGRCRPRRSMPAARAGPPLGASA